MPVITDPAFIAEAEVQRLWGPGAKKMPDGSIAIRGPRGGLTFRKGPDADASPSAVKATEDAGKAFGQLSNMANAEATYQEALKRGYNPTSLSNRLATTFEQMPLSKILGLDGLAPSLRNDASDLAMQAQRQWADAQLRATSGAAVTPGEQKSNFETFFPQPGESPKDIGPFKREARETAYRAAMTRAGPLGAGQPRYMDGLSANQPIALNDAVTRQDLRPGAFYRSPDGAVRKNLNVGQPNAILYTPMDDPQKAYKDAKLAWNDRWYQRKGNLDGADEAFNQWWQTSGWKDRPAFSPKKAAAPLPGQPPRPKTGIAAMSDDEVLKLARGGK